MGTFTLKNGEKCILREATVEDASAMIQYIKKVSGETENLTFGPEEYYTTVEEQIAHIGAVAEHETSTILLAFVGGRLVGCLTVNGNNIRPRLKHSASFGISILQECWGLGLGKVLIEEMITYSKKVGLTKLNLKVRTDNTRGIALYRQFGFVEEGVERRGMRVDGEYVDLMLMGLLLD